MPYVVENLRRFNRKERFYLIGYALDNRAFQLGAHFIKQIEVSTGLSIPDRHFAAMDYHLSWLYASLYLDPKRGDGPYPNGGGIEKGNQEDVDLLIAFEENETTHVVILEAKGVTSWSNKQLTSKMKRLADIFGADGRRFPDVRPHFAILSPFEPSRVRVSDWPKWMLAKGHIPWIHLPTEPDLLKVTRCDQAKRDNATGGFWKVEPDRVSQRAAIP